MSLFKRFLNGESKAASDRLDRATEELSQTVSMNRSDFLKMVDDDRHREISAVIQFEPFASICEFRRASTESAMVICMNPEHEAAKSHIAPCRQGVCPKLRKPPK